MKRLDVKKAKSIQTCLLVLTFFVCLNLNEIPARDCSPLYDCPPNLSTIQDSVRFPQDWHFKWDWINSAAEIDDKHTANVYVVGGQEPYNWTVGGHDGFSLDQSVTTGVANQLINNGACGTAIIHVTDARGMVAVGQVRSTRDSSWQQIGSRPTCRLPGNPDDLSDEINARGYTATRTVGGQRQTETVVFVSGVRTCDAACTTADCDCNRAKFTVSGGGCMPCLSLPPFYRYTPYICRYYSNVLLPLYEGTFYCYDYSVIKCNPNVFGYCGGSVPANAYSCYASTEQYYEEWLCD
jgi:hypothetical protein